MNKQLIDSIMTHGRISNDLALLISEEADLINLMSSAKLLGVQGHGNQLTYSKKIFIPLTMLCRDVCHYCTFAKPPIKGERAFLTPEEVLSIAKSGELAGCKEALFTLGDKPELRYKVVRDELESMGYESTIDYLYAMAKLVLEKTSLLPHLNPGIMNYEQILKLRSVSVSQGIMLESISNKLNKKGEAHYGSPDKEPKLRLKTIEDAGIAKVPFTTGILIGIGESKLERVESLFALRDLNDKYGHIQEIIIQNFRAKPDTLMKNHPEPSLDELLWTISVARLIFGSSMNIQAPPNLSPDSIGPIINSGINDWGGISPVTPDYVNPEAPWPSIVDLTETCKENGRNLIERLSSYPEYALDAFQWHESHIAKIVTNAIDSSGLAREDAWSPGIQVDAPHLLSESKQHIPIILKNNKIDKLLKKTNAGSSLNEDEINDLFHSREEDFLKICNTADELRRQYNGDTVSYVVNRNINYTNVCYFKCKFCAFSKGKTSLNLRGPSYDLSEEEIQRRVVEAWDRGATEVCMQGGIHPDYTGDKYIEICKAVKNAVPEMHIHAFSALEITQGASTLGISIKDFLYQLADAGLSTLPGTAAEILDDEVRAILCPDKIYTQEWLDVHRSAHEIGLKTTATIMFGHIEKPISWARHLIHIKNLQSETNGFTEFVPLPFVHMEAPIYLNGRARKGPTFRESLLMHAISRIILSPEFTNIQGSWVKMGENGIKQLLLAGVNDLGGTLMNESITRAAGAEHGQEMAPDLMEKIITSSSRTPFQRTTLYNKSSSLQHEKSYDSNPLLPIV
ncbi:MAG: FO synthase [Chloroflexi bacterium]|nr:MAG: FO synthase [Chloroflexota bacterium]